MPRRTVLGTVRNDYTADDDEGTANQDTGARPLVKYDPGNELRNNKEKHDVDSEQASEIPRRRIHYIAVRKQNQCARGEQDHSGNCCR